MFFQLVYFPMLNISGRSCSWNMTSKACDTLVKFCVQYVLNEDEKADLYNPLIFSLYQVLE